MGLTMRVKRAVAAEAAARYQKTTKKQKQMLLDELIKTTGYDRSYLAWLLRSHGKKLRVSGKMVIVGDVRKRISRRHRPRIYDDEFQTVLKKLWVIMRYVCGKRMAAGLKDLIAALERHGEMLLDSQTKQKLMKVSPATIDRLLTPERRKVQLKGRSTTKPGTLLKRQIEIRTFSDWDETIPGFVEIDLVAHDGGNSSGEYCHTLDVTDVCTGWTETRAVKNKAQVWVFEALQDIKGRLPFKLLGIDSDNGGEFINHHLLAYCTAQNIKFTRGRPYKKNDNCYVEEKNYSVVRKTVGYARYDNEQELALLNELYSLLRLYTNCFLPVMKLVDKRRFGSKVKKTYAAPLTPYNKVMHSGALTEQAKRQLRKQYLTLNPAQLDRDITALQARLAKLATEKQSANTRTKMGCGKVEIEKRDFHFSTTPTTARTISREQTRKHRQTRKKAA